MNDSQKFKRVRFIRSLEKFTKSIVVAAKRDDYDEVKFLALVAKKREILDKVEPTHLDSQYTKGLQNFANFVANGAKREDIIYEANQLEKIKNAKLKKTRNQRIDDEY